MHGIPYSNVVDSIIYAIVCSRLDIAQVVSMMSRYMGNPRKQHWDAVKWLLRYLKSIIDVYLKFRLDNARLIGYCDSD